MSPSTPRSAARFAHAFSTVRQCGLFRQAVYSRIPPMLYCFDAIGEPSALRARSMSGSATGFGPSSFSSHRSR